MADGRNYVQPEQHITFYNVTGLIERDKNIYYAPQVADLMSQNKESVCESYKSLFDVVCPPPSSDYVDMEISQWNPEDRRLKVRGSVEIFRRGSGVTRDRNILLNYIVLKIDLSRAGDTPYFVGFFITDAVQSGVNTVELTLLPDYFTNTFYWGNTQVLITSFDPFNSLITNAYIERQHYDRVKVTESYYIIDGDVESPSSLEVGKNYTLIPYLINEEDSSQYVDTANVKIQFSQSVVGGSTAYFNRLNVVKRDANWNEISSMLICGIVVDFVARKIVLFAEGRPFHTQVVEEISFDNYFGTSTFITFSLETNQNFHEYAEGVDFAFKSLVSEPENHNQLSDFANMDLFVKTEESYNYRQLFKDLRIPLTFAKPTGVDHVANSIPAEAYTKKSVAEARQYLKDLMEDETTVPVANNIIRACVHYLHIVTNEQITYPTIIEGDTGDSSNPKQYYQAWYNKDFEVENDFPSASQHIVIPFIAEVKGLEAFARYLDGEWISSGQTSEVPHGIAIAGIYQGLNMSGFLTFYDSKSFSQYISNINNKYGYYIQSMFVTPYSELRSYYDSDNDCVVFSGDLVNENTEPTSPLIRKRRGGTWWTGYTYKKIYSPTKVIEDYDDAVISSPTLVMLPFEKVELNANQTEFASVPDVIFELQGTISSPTGVVLKTYVEQGETKSYYDDDILGFGFLVGTKGFEYRTASGDIKKQVVDLEYSVGKEDLIRSYYEPVLEMEPYSFYSISMSEIEAPLDRKRYYQMDNGSPYYPDVDVFYRKSRVPLYYNQAVNTMVKIGVIPEYTINGISQRYYSDELMFVTTSGVTVKVDSFASFMYVMSPQLKAQSHLAVYNAQRDMEKAVISSVGNAVAGAVNQNPAGAIHGLTGILNQQITNEQNIHNVQTNIKAQKASAGNKADTFLQAGSDYIYELNLDEYCVMLNHYRIDEVSYKSIAKMLERYGYFVNLYDHLNIYNRIGYNYIKLAGFDFNESNIKVSDKQMEAIDTIFKQGVTLLHQKDYLHTTSHNYEVVLDLVE